MIPGAPSFALSPANIAGSPHHHPNHPPYQQPRYSLSISIFISMDRRHTLRNHGFASKHYRSFSSLAIFEPKYCNHKIPSRINAFRLIRLGIFSSIANYVSYQVHAFNSRWMIITDKNISAAGMGVQHYRSVQIGATCRMASAIQVSPYRTKGLGGIICPAEWRLCHSVASIWTLPKIALNSHASTQRVDTNHQLKSPTTKTWLLS